MIVLFVDWFNKQRSSNRPAPGNCLVRQTGCFNNWRWKLSPSYIMARYPGKVVISPWFLASWNEILPWCALADIGYDADDNDIGQPFHFIGWHACSKIPRCCSDWSARQRKVKPNWNWNYGETAILNWYVITGIETFHNVVLLLLPVISITGILEFSHDDGQLPCKARSGSFTNRKLASVLYISVDGAFLLTKIGTRAAYIIQEYVCLSFVLVLRAKKRLCLRQRPVVGKPVAVVVSSRNKFFGSDNFSNPFNWVFHIHFNFLDLQRFLVVLCIKGRYFLCNLFYF